MGAGDSLFAPRKVPHAFAHIGDQSRMLTMFQPAGRMEAYFKELGKIKTEPSEETLRQLYRDHGMGIVGRPLSVE